MRWCAYTVTPSVLHLGLHVHTLKPHVFCGTSLQFLETIKSNVTLTQEMQAGNQFDQQLWEHAKGLFCKHLAANRAQVVENDVRVAKELASGICTGIV